MLPLTFDRYRTVAWNVGIVLTQVQLADHLDGLNDLPRTNTVMRTMVSAYLDLLAHEFPVIQPLMPADTLHGQAVVIKDQALFREAKPTKALATAFTAEIAEGRHPIVVTLQSATIPAQRLATNAGIGTKVTVASIEEFVTGLVLKDAILQGLAWRSCVVKFLAAYNFIIASSGDPNASELGIEGRK